MTSSVRVTDGNFRLLNQLLIQIERTREINQLSMRVQRLWMPVAEQPQPGQATSG